tara:strand:- start:321 stop:506 length:186 start_codon:yes stop_codon:yes gene_type:complete
MKVNDKSPRPHDCQLIEQALEMARPWGLEAEVVWSMATHFKAYPHDNVETALTVALDDWDL